MNKRVLVYVISGALVIGGVIGLGLTRPATAKASPAPAQTTGANGDATAEKDGAKESGTVENNAENGSAEETAEAASLQAMAKITPDQAKAAALQAVPGTVLKVELDNENGNLVYSVEIKTANGDQDVKVDAGNGTVVAQDSQQDDGDKAQGNDNEKDSGAPDNDQVQEESQN
ncbi:MAG TPA: PepSY domain-containing protein [Bacillota bacterium]|jgi:uncharacterized membrane protein YkoI